MATKRDEESLKGFLEEFRSFRHEQEQRLEVQRLLRQQIEWLAQEVTRTVEAVEQAVGVPAQRPNLTLLQGDDNA
jgi:CHASE3 domain sensor protein